MGGFVASNVGGIRFGSVCLCLFPVRTNSPYWLSGCKRAWIKPKSKCMFYVFVVCYAFSGFPFLIELRKPFPLWPNDHFVLQPHRTEFQNIMPKTGQHLTVNLSENGYGGRITRTKKSNTGKNEQQQQQEWENECVNEERMVDIEEMEGRGLVGREWKAKEYHERNTRNE